MNGINVQYLAGFAVSGEAWTIPASARYQEQVFAPFGSWGQDDGVIDAGGQALVAVSDTPAQGQYAVTNGSCTFAAADAGRAILISYSSVPSDIEQACCELVSERFKYKGRIGMVSKSLNGQESVSFSQKDI
jgi:hypothetical protein